MPNSAPYAPVGKQHEGMSDPSSHVVIVGGGFAGIACAKRPAGEPSTRVTLLDSPRIRWDQV